MHVVLARIHGLMSQKVLKEFRGHSAAVNDANYSPDGTMIVTAGNEGAIKASAFGVAGLVSVSREGAAVPANTLLPVAMSCRQLWDFKTSDCLRTFSPPQASMLTDCACNSVAFLPRHRDQLVVSNRTGSVYIMSLAGEVRWMLGCAARWYSDVLYDVCVCICVCCQPSRRVRSCCSHCRRVRR